MSVIQKVLIVLVAVLAAWGVLWLIEIAMRRSRTRSAGLSAAGWALLFLFSGRMPPPPPETQIELERHTEKDRESARDVDS